MILTLVRHCLHSFIRLQGQNKLRAFVRLLWLSRDKSNEEEKKNYEKNGIYALDR